MLVDSNRDRAGDGSIDISEVGPVSTVNGGSIHAPPTSTDPDGNA
jgi:hypothetical protein